MEKFIWNGIRNDLERIFVKNNETGRKYGIQLEEILYKDMGWDATVRPLRRTRERKL